MSVMKALSEELEALVKKTSPAVVGIEHGRGQGTGLVLAPDGYVLTNAHVIRGSSRIQVEFSDGAAHRGVVVGRDARTDLGVLKVGAGNLTSLPLADSRAIKVGQLVVAIGNPFRFERSISLGVVSALDRSLPAPGGHLHEALIQTDAAINPGNSGGPLVDADGAVVGINTAIIPYAQGIGFAIPAHTASWVAAVLIKKGEVARPFIGISARGEELETAVSLETGRERAVRVFKVGPSTPADLGGLRDGDFVLSANGSPVASIDDLQRIMVLSDSPELTIDVWRKGKRQALSIRPAANAQAA
jgi:S1-C subfamily serine protease